MTRWLRLRAERARIFVAMTTPASLLSTAIDDLHSIPLLPEPLEEADIVAGAPEVLDGPIRVSADGRVLTGVWKVTPGSFTDVMIGDEMFVVLEGTATIEGEDGAVLELSPGTVCVFAEGYRSTWTVHTTLFKVYQIAASRPPIS